MTLGELIGPEADLPASWLQTPISGLTADSRAVKPGYLFAALPGSRTDGACFIAEALQKGAAAILVPRGASHALNGTPVIEDVDPRRRLALIAARFFAVQPEVTVAVTGTNGKTSVASFVRQLWEQMGYRAASLGTVKTNGRTRPATHRDLILAFSLMGFVFCDAHLLFSFVFFAGNWTKVVRGPITFWQHMVIASGAWVPLLLSLIGGLARYIFTPPHPRLIAGAMERIGFVGKPATGDVGSAYATLFWRIFAMQAAIIFGAMFVQSYKATNAPLYILIGLKTLSDLAGTVKLRPQVVTSLRK